MRPPRSPRGGFHFSWTTTRVIIAVNLAASLLLQPLLVMIFEKNFRSFFLLSAAALKSGHVWTLATYSIFHAGLFHLLGNMIGLWFMGEFIEKSDGRHRLLTVYLGGILAGALLWLTLSFSSSPLLQTIPCLGASAGVFALMAYALVKLYNQPITIFIYFILPITLRSKWVLAGLSAVTLGGLFFSEMPTMLGGQFDSAPIAHSAHLGGLLWGLGVFGWLKFRAGDGQKIRRKMQPLRQTVFVRHTAAKKTAGDGDGRVDNITPFTRNDPAFLRSEVDRILDKISAQGYGALSDDERELLDRAGPLFGKK